MVNGETPGGHIALMYAVEQCGLTLLALQWVDQRKGLYYGLLQNFVNGNKNVHLSNFANVNEIHNRHV